MAVIPLDDSTDARGMSFSLLDDSIGRIGRIRDMHVAEIRPGAIRGDHYHARRGEIIVVLYRDRWSLHWDRGAGTSTERKDFEGAGAVAVVPPREWSHAVRNDGHESLTIIAVSDAPYDRHDTSEQARDAVRRVVTSP